MALPLPPPCSPLKAVLFCWLNLNSFKDCKKRITENLFFSCRIILLAAPGQRKYTEELEL